MKKDTELTKSNNCQVFLLHFAGGSRRSFDFLRSLMRKDLDFIPLEIPGRGDRMHETFLETKELVIEDYCHQVKKLRNGRPYLIYGHSMGATMGLNVANKMEADKDPPCQLIVSGNAGPGVKDETCTKGKRYLMEETEFKAELKELGGIPEEVLENEELYEFFSPILRADFKVLEMEEGPIEEGVKIKIPIHAIMGDTEKTSNKIENWNRFTTGNFQSTILKGNHFFIYNHAERIVDIIHRSFLLREYHKQGLLYE